MQNLTKTTPTKNTPHKKTSQIKKKEEEERKRKKKKKKGRKKEEETKKEEPDKNQVKLEDKKVIITGREPSGIFPKPKPIEGCMNRSIEASENRKTSIAHNNCAGPPCRSP